MEDMLAKRLTVTFQDVTVEVAGLGEDTAPTVGSVLTDLLPTGQGRKSTRVSVNSSFYVSLVDKRDSTSCKAYLAR